MEVAAAPGVEWGGGSQLTGVSLTLEVHTRGAIKSGLP